MFGGDPKTSSPAESVIYSDIKHLQKKGCTWYFPKEFQQETLFLKKNLGFLPDPFSTRIIVFGERYDEIGDFDEEEEIFTFGLEKEEFEAKEGNIGVELDTCNMPMWFKGAYYVYGEGLESVVVCKRNFEVFE